VIPTYNRREALAEALASVRAQTRPADEVVVVDDGSTDGTSEADADGSRYVRQKNRGPSAARNRGLSEATSDWVAFLDSDDRWAADKLERQVPRLTEGTVLVYAREQGQDAEGEPLVHIRPRTAPEGEVLASLVRGNFVPTSTAVVLREAALAEGGFDEEMTHSEDWDLWLRLARRGRFAVCREVLSYYRFHEDQLISDRLALSLGRHRVLEKLLGRHGDDPVLGPVIRRRIADRRLRLARRLAKSGNREEARRFARRLSLLTVPGIRARWAVLTHRGGAS
jgi:glycosyltransferase involved in cell wall biosynthesis